MSKSKDQSYRERLAKCNNVVGEVISKLLDGDNSYLTTRCVYERTMTVMKAKHRLHDARFVLQWLRKLMQPIIAENTSSSVSVQDAFQALESFLTQYANPVQKLECANEIDEHLPDSISLTALQREMVAQPEATADQTQQLITEDKVFSIVKNMVNEVLGPYLGRLQNQKLTNPVSIHGDLESSRGAEIHNNVQGLLSLPCSFDIENYDDFEVCYLSGEGEARANQHNMKLSQEIFTVQGYNIHGRNSNVLTNIFQKHPRIDNKFLLFRYADIHNSLPVYHNPEMLELMHYLTNKLAKAKDKRLVEEIKKNEADIKKGKMKLVKDKADSKENQLMLPKKPRFI
ncbi:hypothetical protein J1N35_009078 [Gossypium stocksii]|uniref:Uncharacterized protein n=1 Tax=Gossypium stocksii TaxID=47602 RepID=A0A9D3WBF0_9ROSI|nr:hypothetical protein J1N35_009078 [Gossypium stocksii]